MAVWVLIDREQARALDRAARWLDILKAVERAHLLDDPDSIESLLGQVDPEQLRLDAVTVRMLYEAHERMVAA